MTIRVSVRWSDGDNYGVQEFRIYRSTSPFDMNDLPAPLAVEPPDSREYLDETVVAQTTYFYLVSTFVDGVESFAEEQSVVASEENVSIEFFPTFPTGRTGDVQLWEVPVTRNYRLTAYGAQGAVGSRLGEGGKGAKMSGVFSLNAGDKLRIVVGQMGTINVNPEGPGGGGASFVAKEEPPAPLIQNGAVFVRRGSTPTAYDQAVIDLVIGLGFACDVIPAGSINTHDYTNRELLIMGAPGSGYTAPENASSLEGLNIHILSMCRHTSRNALSMSGDSGGQDATDVVTQNPLHPISLKLGLSASQSVTLGTATGLQGIWNLNSGVTLPFGHSADTSRPGIAERQRDNLWLRRHCSYYQWNTATPEGLEFLEAVLTKDVAEFLLEPLVVAGGGGGYGVGTTLDYQSRAHATTDPNGKSGFGGNSFGAGGTDGNGGVGASSRGGGGGGWLSSATGGGGAGGALISGGLGGDGEGNGGDGGFGGGGAVNQSTGWGAAGGGGGYSGGGGAYASDDAGEAAGGGGGSYNAGASQENEAGVREGPGYVVISPAP